MYYQSDAQTFKQLAQDLRIYKRVDISTSVKRPDWGEVIGKRIEAIFLDDFQARGKQLLSVSYDGEGTEREGRRHLLFSITRPQNKSMVNHVTLIQYEEADV